MRKRDSDGDGTSNLSRNAKNCERRNALMSGSSGQNGSVIAPYSEARHRTIIALRCAVSKRPFNMVNDPLYLAECRLLRGDPALQLPSVFTVQRDAN
jgi:hypothetical protein